MTVDESLQHYRREANNTKYDLSGFTVQVATLDDWEHVTSWGNAESWNIGPRDAECFFKIDPDGFFIGKVDGRPVSAVSLVNYSDRFAVWGHYLVAPGERGKGYGLGVCKTASRHSGDRVTAGDGMPEQVDNYAKDGSKPAYRTVHYLGRVPEGIQPDPGISPLENQHIDKIVHLDSTAFPALRPTFLNAWLTAEGHHTFVSQAKDGDVDGYIVIRPAVSGYRIGPLVATGPAIAQSLLHTAVSGLRPGTTVSVFAPDVQQATPGLLREIGLQEHFHVVRMHRGQPPLHDPRRMYAIGSLELG